MRITDQTITRLKDAARESAAQQAKMAEGPTLPETLHEIPDDWIMEKQDRAEKAVGCSLSIAAFLLYIGYLTDAYKEENERMLQHGEKMD